MQINTKPFRITRSEKRSQTVGKHFLCPVVEVKPFNPWQSIYIRDFKKSLKKNVSLGPKMMKEGTKAMEQRPQQTMVTQSQKCLPVIVKPCSMTQEQAPRVNFRVESQVKDEGREFEIKPNMSEVFPNMKSHQDRKLNCIISDNTEYFAHVMGKCICGICVCGQCKCKHPRELNLGLKNNDEKSMYRQDYINHGSRARRELRKQKTEQLAYKEPFGGDTLYRVDYISMNPNKVVELQKFSKIERPGFDDTLGKLKAPFPGNSSYGETYLNWQNSVPVVRFGDKEEYVKSKLPFTGKGLNQEYGNFRPEDITNQVDNTMFGKSQFKNPLGPDGAFKGESTTHNAFKKIDAYDKPRNYKENHNKENNINSDGHFSTTYKDYAGEKPQKCPAKEIISDARKQMIDHSVQVYSGLIKKIA